MSAARPYRLVPAPPPRLLKINAPNHFPVGGTFELDGVPLTDCRALTLRMSTDDVTTVELDLRVGVDFDGQVRPVLSEETKALLVRFGWTPPDDAEGTTP